MMFVSDCFGYLPRYFGVPGKVSANAVRLHLLVFGKDPDADIAMFVCISRPARTGKYSSRVAD
jgi:hypothetical protein